MNDPCMLLADTSLTTQNLRHILQRDLLTLQRREHTHVLPQPEVLLEASGIVHVDEKPAHKHMTVELDVLVVTPFLVKHLHQGAKVELAQSIPKDNFHRFCYRHNPEIVCNKQADARKMKLIQLELEALPSRDREAISHVWLIFSAAPHHHRSLILKGLLSQCCFPQLLMISQEVSQLIRIDFIATLPVEIALKILCFLDCKSLCSAAQVSRRWKELADDDRVWHHMCEQHIDRKCPNCGWGLPLMHMKRAREAADERGAKRRRPWKLVYSERFQLEKNWRNGTHAVREFHGHTDGVTCIQYNRKYLMLGLYDGTVKIWNAESGECLKTLAGHLKGVRALAFDVHKLITGGQDTTIKVWNYHTGQCILTYQGGHLDAVTSVDFSNKTIVSGSADCTVKVWHVDLRTCYTLRGHSEGVNCVKIHVPSNTVFSASDDTTVKMWDLKTNECLRVFGGIDSNGHVGQVERVIPFVYTGSDLVEDNPELDGESGPARARPALAQADTNATQLRSDGCYPTHILTSSLDNTIKIWDVQLGKCIRTQFGHIEGVWSISADTFRVVSGAHDRLVKVWDLQDGKCVHTFGHNASVCCVALSSSSLVAGLENGNIKMYCFN